MADGSSANVSTSSVISTLVANLVLCGIFVTCFLILRLKFKRIYTPKSSFDLVDDEKKPTPLPKDPVRWIFILLTKPHSFIIQQAGLDGYFFLRYILVMATFFLFSLLTWIILLPINATNGKGDKGFDQLSMSNVKNEKRYYAHVFVGWVFYGGLIFIIYRELFFFNSFRAAVLSSPRYANKLSSRTILFQSVPDALLDEKQFFKLFNGVKRIYVARTLRELDIKSKKREALAIKLESAENKLLRQAVKYKRKCDKKNITIENPDDIYSYVPEKKRPRQKEGGFFSKKIDTITYLRETIPKLDKEVRHLQKKYRTAKPKNSIFVEFDNQYMAQLAYQSTTHHNPLRMCPAYTGIDPGDIQWSNLRLFWWEGITRKFIASAAIIVLIIFWAVPVAFVGVISNLSSITDKLTFLRFIYKLPSALLGLITGLLPSVMLALLMSLLPMFIRAMAKVAGCVSTQHVELFTQNSYFAFLIINGFLVTTIASSATSTVTKIIQKPESAMTLLAQNLPKSSNFYISYLILQGLTVAGGSLFQVVGLFLYYILGALLDKTLRKKWARFSGLGSMAWGTTFPVFTNLACITLAYSMISPLIILFACVAFYLVYITYCHNLTYVFVEGTDARGAHYPKALFQTFTGIYLGQVCLLGLFAVGKGWGPIILQIIGICATIFCHVNLNHAFDHLLTVVPIDVMKPLDGVSHTCSFNGESDYKQKVLDRKRKAARKSKLNGDKKELEKLNHDLNKDKLELEKIRDKLHQDEKEQSKVNVELLVPDVELQSRETSGSLVPLLADRDFKSVKHVNFLIKFLRPDVFLNYRHIKELLPATYNIEPEVVDDKHAYDQPVVASKLPVLWIPEDPMGLSKLEISENKKFIECTDINSGFNKKGNIIYTGKPPY